MLVQLQPTDQRRDHSLMAFIEGIPSFLERGTSGPTIPGEYEMMVSRVIFPRVTIDGYETFDFTKVKCFLIRQPTEEDQKVNFDGFEMAGSMCRTDSMANYTHKPCDQKFRITPGHVGVYVAENVNARFNGSNYYPKIPGVGWVKHIEGRPPRLEGVDDPKYLAVNNQNVVQQHRPPSWLRS